MGSGASATVTAAIATMSDRDLQEVLAELPDDNRKKLQSALVGFQGTSTVIIDPKDWCDDSLLIPHEAIRIMLLSMRRFKLDSKEKISAFSKWYNGIFYEVVKHHHHAEEDIYFPWLTKNVPFPDGKGVADDHEKLMLAMEEIKTKSDKAMETGSSSELEPLLAPFVEQMMAHLNEEETIAPGMLRQSGYTPQDEGAVIGQIVEGLGPAGNAIFLPLITEAMDRAGGYASMNSEGFKKMLPPPVQEMFPNFVDGMKEDNLKVMTMLVG